MSARGIQPAASNNGSWAGSIKVAWALDSLFCKHTASAPLRRCGASAGSLSSSRGPVAGVKGAAIWSLG